MKKINAVLFFAVFAAVTAHAQMAVVDAGMTTLMTKLHADQAVYYVQSLMEMYNNAQNTYNQFQNMIRAEQRALANLKNITKVENFKDFMEWQNRQLYLERQAENRFKNMGIKIGGKTYHMSEIEEIPGAANNQFGEPYWDDFSEAQRKEMWTKLGLTPSNYTYIKAWETREEAIAARLLTLSEDLNEDYIAAVDKWNWLSEEYKNGGDESIQEKRVLMDIASILMDTNLQQRSMAYDMALEREMDMAAAKKAKAARFSEELSGSYNADPFAKITED
ncbi:MAG: hypothetical protein LBB82_01755 [Treponema sp.]|jgi:hypothetical protein|nr:hypothetical protein [Treponema sp.]